jgi:hypothetical protein
MRFSEDYRGLRESDLMDRPCPTELAVDKVRKRPSARLTLRMISTRILLLAMGTSLKSQDHKLIADG